MFLDALGFSPSMFLQMTGSGQIRTDTYYILHIESARLALVAVLKRDSSELSGIIERFGYLKSLSHL